MKKFKFFFFIPVLITAFTLIASGSALAQQQPTNMRLRSKMKFASMANVFGYSAKGREYALGGSGNGVEIIDITNPDTPKLIKHIPALQSVWREIKTYKNFMYVTTDFSGSNPAQGFIVADLSNLPDTNVVYKTVNGPDSLLTLITRTHALHVDTTKGYLYLYGGVATFSDIGNSAGAIVMDIKTDPWKPKFVGRYTPNYIHDGYADNDTVWSGQIYKGTITVLDFHDKKNPLTIGEVKTPYTFTHNTWLSPDHKTCFSTDERVGAYMASYDVSDLTNIKLLDKVRSTAGDNAIVHNAHILNNYAVTSWYSEGVLIHDVSRPKNMIQVGQFDTYQCGSNGNFVGTWGAYPFFSSGNIVLSNLEGDFFVLTPTYQRACYLEGIASDINTNLPLSGVRVKIIKHQRYFETYDSTGIDKLAVSSDIGEFYTGLATPDYYDVAFIKPGYVTTVARNTQLSSGQITTVNVKLKPAKNFTVKGVGNKNDFVRLTSPSDEYIVKADTGGNFSIANVVEGDYIYQRSSTQLGFFITRVSIKNDTTFGGVGGQYISFSTLLDGFKFDLGWQVEGTTTAGKWTRGKPVASSTEKGYLWRPKTDATNSFYDDASIPFNDGYLYSTGSGTCIGGNDGLINNYTTLVSPALPKSYLNRTTRLTFNYWYTNQDTATKTGGSLKVFIRSGSSEQELFTTSSSNPTWQATSFFLGNVISQSDSFKIVVKAVSTGNYFTEAAIDNIKIELSVPTLDIDNNFTLQAIPNPFLSSCNIKFDLGADTNTAEVQVFNTVGQLVEIKKLNATDTSADIGKELPSGVYLAKIITNNKISRAVRLVKAF